MTLIETTISIGNMLATLPRTRDRLKATNHDNWPKQFEGPWFYGLLVVLGIILVAAIVGIVVHYRKKRLAKVAGSFRSQGESLGLNDEELSLLASIAMRATPRDPMAVFASQDLFSDGLTNLVEADRLEDIFSVKHRSTCHHCPFTVSLREKLGFSIMPGLAKPSDIQLGPLPDGAILSVERNRSPQQFEVTLIRMEHNPLQLRVKAEDDIRSRPGESWQIHFPRGGVLWEFNAWVARHIDGEILIRPVGQVRWINRRRFPRVPTNKIVWSASFPFDRGNLLEDEAPQFVQGRLIEIAGPGLRIEAPLNVQPGDRVLVLLALEPERIVESSAIVRRVDRDGESFAAEFTGLNTSEIAELARQTNLAARETASPGITVSIGREV